MNRHKRQQSESVQENTSLTQTLRAAIVARIVEVILSDSGQANIQTEVGNGIIDYPNRPRSPNPDDQDSIAGSFLDGGQQYTVKALSNGLASNTNLPLSPEAQALRQVTMRQAAEILGVHERTIRRLVQAGELSVVGRGRLTRIALRDIAGYQQRNRR